MAVTQTAGPGDRVAFFDEQRRNRRATWRLAVASVAGVAAMGLPVSLVITPLVYGFVLICGELFNLVHPLPAAVIGPIASALTAFGAALDGLSGKFAGQTAAPSALVLLAAALVAPGVVVIVGIWLGVRAVLSRSGVGGLLLALGARDPRPGDFEERQLQNLIEEMAVAAGLSPPRVVLLDSEGANAAVIGSHAADATVVMSRRLLDDFSRDETQAIAGHLVGSISNGDLRIAFTLASVFQTFGLLITLLDAPFGKASAESLRRLVRIILRRTGDVPETDLVGALLAGRLSLNSADDVAAAGNENPGIWAPLMLANQSVKWTLFLFTTAIVGPVLALLWRARRYLADATAVQLTRNPEALWTALAHLIQDGGIVPGGERAVYLFIVGPESVGWRRPAGGKGWMPTDDKMGTNSFIGFHPQIDRRLRRLQLQGATSRLSEARVERTPAQRIVYGAGAVFVGLLFGVGMIAAFAGMVLFVGVSLFIDALFLGAVHAVFLVLGVIKSAIIG
jgi:Zn-dependent protease with chaperone function